MYYCGRNNGFFEKECLIFISWKLLLEPCDNKVQRIIYSNQLNAGEPTVILCICNYLGLGVALKILNELETGIDYGQVSKYAYYET